MQALPSKSMAALDQFGPTMEAAELPDLQVLVHCFSWCCCRSKIFSADHIKITILKRPVKTGQAVALSYGIGDFDRENHLFGHVDVGGEWEIQGLANALVTLSERHGAIWFDQLSHRIWLLSRSICRTCHEFTASSRS
jgi:hypothetical protein